MASSAVDELRDRTPSSRDSQLLPCAGVPIPPEATFAKLSVLSRDAIAARIAAGELLVIHAPLVYRVPHAWLKLHPGGDIALLHYVGRDASNEIEAYHTGRTVAKRMSRWICGRVELDEAGWTDMIPPVQLGLWPVPVPRITVTADGEVLARGKVKEGGEATLTAEMVNPPVDESALPLTPEYQQHLRESHRRFQEKLHDMGLDTPPAPLSGYGPSLAIYVGLGVLWIWLYMRATSTLGYFCCAVALGAFWHQVTFVAHDAGHTGITGDWTTDRIIGILLANFMGGMSIGWWCDNHNVHHLVTNSPEHDPDIQHLPFFAISTKFFNSLTSSYYKRVMKLDGFAKWVLPYQHNLYYIILSFARFNLFFLSYSFLLRSFPARKSDLFKLRLFEIVGIAFFWWWFGNVLRAIPSVGDRIMFLLVSFAVTSPLHVQIVLSHFSQPVSVTSTSHPHAELLEAFAHRQLRTTMDIVCPPYLDFLHGGLNFQTPHHLLPRTPRFRLRRVAKEVEKWVEEENVQVVDGVWRGRRLKEGEGLMYKKMEFVAANRSVLGVLKSVGQQVKLLAEVAKAEAKGELHHAH